MTSPFLRSALLTCATLFAASAWADSATLICIWEAGGGKKKAYIIEYDSEKQTVDFNGAAATSPHIDSENIDFVLSFPNVHWDHRIHRRTGKLTVHKSDAPDTLEMQCGKLLSQDL